MPTAMPTPSAPHAQIGTPAGVPEISGGGIGGGGIDGTLPDSSPPLPDQPNLTNTAAKGFVWTLGQTLGSKVFMLGAQLALAWFLGPEIFGLFAYAMTVTMFTGQITQIGVREVLVSRQARFAQYANAGFWLSVTAGLVGCLATLAAIPIAVWWYSAPELVPILVLLAIAMPFGSLPLVADARLQNDLRFGYLSRVNTMMALWASLTMVAGALAGLGVYSLVLPEFVKVLYRGFMLWREISFRPTWRLQVHRWKYLLGDGLLVLATNGFLVAGATGDKIILGYYATKGTVGVYAQAYSLTLQTVFLLIPNLSAILFPTLSRMGDDPVRQTAALLRAIRLMAAITIPACMLQAVTSDPLVRLAFKPEWEGMIILAQILCAGMWLRVLGWTALSLLQSQRRFRTQFIFAAVSSAGFFVAVWIGARTGQDVGVAAATAIFFLLCDPVILYISIRPGGGRARDIVSACGLPIVLSLVAAGAALGADRLIPAGLPWPQVVRLGVIGTVASLFYAGLAWFLMADRRREFIGLVMRMARRGK